MIISRSLPLKQHGFTFMAGEHPTVYTHHCSLSVHGSVGAWAAFLSRLRKRCCYDIRAHVSFLITVLSGYTLHSGAAGSYGNFIFHFLRHLHAVLCRGCTNLPFHRQCRRFSLLHTLSGVYCLWISGWWPLWWCLLTLCEFSLFLGEMSIFDWVVCFCDAELEEQHSFQVILDISVSVLTTYTEVIFWFLTCPERLPVSHRRLTLEGRGTLQVIPVADDQCWGLWRGL